MAYTAVTKATLHFSPKIYTGTGSSLALTGLGFQPDIVWQKVRSTTSSHRITDVVRKSVCFNIMLRGKYGIDHSLQQVVL